MRAFKIKLRQVLADHGWEVVEVAAPVEWWTEECWKIQSRRNAWGLEIVLTFLVDPMWDAPNRKKEAAVWAVSATTEVPADRLSAESGITELCKVRGRVEENVAAFVHAISGYRDAQ